MTGWLLDTNVISELRKPNCNASVKKWADAQTRDSLYISVITLAEIRYGIEFVENEPKRVELTRWLEREVRPWFSGRILEATEAVFLRWRIMVEEGRKKGHTFSQPDLFIAAQAQQNGLCVVTRNQKDFLLANVRTSNPWNEAVSEA